MMFSQLGSGNLPSKPLGSQFTFTGLCSVNKHLPSGTLGPGVVVNTEDPDPVSAFMEGTVERIHTNICL